MNVPWRRSLPLQAWHRRSGWSQRPEGGWRNTGRRALECCARLDQGVAGARSSKPLNGSRRSGRVAPYPERGHFWRLFVTDCLVGPAAMIQAVRPQLLAHLNASNRVIYVAVIPSRALVDAPVLSVRAHL